MTSDLDASKENDIKDLIAESKENADITENNKSYFEHKKNSGLGDLTGINATINSQKSEEGTAEFQLHL